MNPFKNFSINQIRAIEARMEKFISAAPEFLKGDPIKMIIDSADLMQLLLISPSTLRYWRNKNYLPYSRIGNKFFFFLSDIWELLQETKTKNTTH